MERKLYELLVPSLSQTFPNLAQWSPPVDRIKVLAKPNSRDGDRNMGWMIGWMTTASSWAKSPNKPALSSIETR
ncbi:hypothetical protein CIRG_02202 [Coccidioides immitis RMSCC 2394]|uniref:Uncharacterized protein n=1 Tax=Coccidioides immitis RMSCC 2394 TaxID=404692 RepID=A0A0J6Y5X8_COCIT|nr:hypothetical protein CIRG_02202 [Coccidioides immitis RMSCC 2394]